MSDVKFAFGFEIIKAPRLYIKPQIKGKVRGFPITVPNKAAIKLPLIIKASITAKKKCNPSNGVNETMAPQAKPEEIAYVEAGSLANRNQ